MIDSGGPNHIATCRFDSCAGCGGLGLAGDMTHDADGKDLLCASCVEERASLRRQKEGEA